jgi:pimeloyl-ACP methyl ester carboxylesterase
MNMTTFLKHLCAVSVLVAAAVLPNLSFSANAASTPLVTPWAGATDHSPSSATCADYMFSVAIRQGGPANQHVFGRLCSQGPLSGKLLQILVHGGSYNHTYWDFPYEPDTYSYVQSATSNGSATLAVDLPGYGYSSHPLGTLLTFDTMAYAVHQVVQEVRAGDLGVTFSKVLLVGHSMGSLTSWVEAGKYHDVDGLISTGAEHEINAVTVATKVLTLLTEPAAVDPKFASSGLIDYTTSYPGIRHEAFYYQPNTDPGIYPIDEETKDTIPVGQWATMLLPLANTALSKKIDVPVLVVDGDYDRFYCQTTCSAAGSAAQKEHANFSGSRCYELEIVPNAGHDVNLSRSAPLWYANANAWLNRCGLR